MKQIINGKMYNTATATPIGRYEYGGGPRNFRWFSETLYRKKTGEFFLAGEGGPRTRYAVDCGNNCVSGGEDIIPLNIEEAKEWAESFLSTDEYILAFGEPEE